MRSVVSSPARKDPKPASGSSPKPATCRRRYVKIVVTDDQGRYLIPGLPKANYDVWVRGYGLIDSPRSKTALGKTVNLKSVPAPNEAAAAQYYPAIYWYSMVKVPEANLFPGTGVGRQRHAAVAARIRACGSVT